MHDLFISLCKNFDSSCNVPKVDLKPRLSSEKVSELNQLLMQAEASYKIISESRRYKYNNKIKSLKKKIDFLKSKVSNLSV